MTMCSARRVFVGYVSTYDFQRAVDDSGTVPLYYDARGDKLGIAVGELNERIAEKLKEEKLRVDHWRERKRFATRFG